MSGFNTGVWPFTQSGARVRRGEVPRLARKDPAHRHEFCPTFRMLHPWQYPAEGRRDLRIDWLRGLAMTCVIIDHSKLSSLLSWFSFERFWVVSAAEVFVVLSGIVLGMVYGNRLIRGDWPAVVRGLGRRALMLYVVFVAVTLSVHALSLAGIDVRSLAMPDQRHPGLAWCLDPRTMNAAALRDVARS